jgi:hypothetical protein
MKYLLVILLAISTNILSDNHPILHLLNDQVDAFNQRDVTRLVNNLSENFKWYSLTSDQLLIETSGKNDFKKSMQNYYASRPQKIFSSVENYTIDGKRVSFREVVSYKNKNGQMVSSSAMGIYEIRDGKIYRAWYFID